MDDKELIEIIRKSGLTRFEFAKKLGVSLPALDSWQYRRRSVPDRMARLINSLFVDNRTNDTASPYREIEDNIQKIERLYQKLIDIKLMSNKHKNLAVEKGLGDYIDEFAVTLNQYRSDNFYHSSGSTLYKEFEPRKIRDLSDNELRQYVKELKDNVQLFEDTFFMEFKEFYNKYMSGWYDR